MKVWARKMRARRLKERPKIEVPRQIEFIQTR
jgi:hypothetical protein